MKSAEIRNLSGDEIDSKVIELKKELFKLRVQAKNKTLETLSRLTMTRRDIARLLTIKKEQEKVTRGN